MDYAVFSFNGARYYNESKKENLFDGNTPIKWNNVSNAIHSMINLRPKPYNRKTIYETVSEIDDLCKQAYMKITTPFNYTTKNNNVYFIYEFIQGKGEESGIRYNSHLKSNIFSTKNNQYNGELTWSTIYKTFMPLEEEKYNSFMTFFKKHFGENVEEENTLVDIIDIVKQNEIIEKELETLAIKNGYICLLRNFTGLTSFNRKRGALYNNVKPQNTLTFNGTVILPVNEKLKKCLIQSKRFSTILDGGIFEFKTIIFNPVIEKYIDNGFYLMEER